MADKPVPPPSEKLPSKPGWTKPQSSSSPQVNNGGNSGQAEHSRGMAMDGKPGNRPKK